MTVNNAATSLAQPRRRTAREETTQPPKMKGRRRPKEEREESERTPTRGWTIKPERGPAIKTKLMADFDNPSEMRKGEAVIYTE